MYPTSTSDRKAQKHTNCLFAPSSLRVKFLEMENKELQEKTLTLANQIGILDRALRNLQSMCTVEVSNCSFYYNLNKHFRFELH